MSLPTVSVVVAAYNATKYLKENIESLLNQSFKDFELIYVNDGSTDNTLSVLEEYQKKDKRIKIISQENHGAGHARNTGLKAATGKYVLVLDADDFFDEYMLEKTVRDAEDKELDILIFDCYTYHEQTKEITNGGTCIVFDLLPDKEVFSAKDIPECIFQITGENVWNKLYRKKFLEQHDIWFQEGNRIIDDLYLEIVALSEAERIGVLPQRLIYYRYANPTSQMSAIAAVSDNECKACEAVYNTLRERGTLFLVESSYVKLAYASIVNSLYRSNYKRFEEIYTTVQSVWLNKLGMLNKPAEFFFDNYQYEVYKNMQNMGASEFLLWQMECTPIAEWNYLVPAEVLKQKDKLVIYGAGLVGKDYYEQVLISRECELVAWVDQRYEELQQMGYKVVSPQELQEMEYDCIFFALENHGLVEHVMDSLVKMGIDREKMLWIKPRRNFLKSN